MKETAAPTSYKIALGLTVCLVFGVWIMTKDIRIGWYGVPPAPDYQTLMVSALGDEQFAYRQAGMTLQDLGNEGGEVTSLLDYDYQKLDGWFDALYALDQRSDFVPMLAAYYFGATRDPDDALILTDFLETAGTDPYGEKWRWLAQAVFLARYRAEDLDRALELAYKLQNMAETDPNVPIWARSMPAFVLKAQGETEAARLLLQAILGSAKDLHPNEMNFMQGYIEERLSDE